MENKKSYFHFFFPLGDIQLSILIDRDVLTCVWNGDFVTLCELLRGSFKLQMLLKEIKLKYFG